MIRWLLVVACALLSFAPLAQAEDPAEAEPAREQKVLVIGIDGCRFDALEEAETPNLDALIAAGIFDRDCQILGDRYRQNDTISGPGWSSILTGVWADKHSVDGNDFDTPNYEDYPHFFAHVKAELPQAETASFIGWGPISTEILSAADVDVNSDLAGLDYPEKDERTETAVLEYLEAGDPTAMFVYFAQVDGLGHRHGFHPTVPEYVAAIEQVDGHVGAVLAAVRARPTYEQENWLVLVVSDHGGQGTTHSNGQNIPEILNSMLIVSGAAAAQGEFEETTYLVDVVPTALAHLEIEPKEEWGLDGHAVGLAEEETAEP